jgi:hypothetical protein
MSFGIGEISGELKFVNSSGNTASSINQLLVYNCKYPSSRLKNIKLTEKGIIAKNGGNFESSCGTHFINTIYFGARLYVLLSFQASNSETLQNIQGKLSGNILGIAEIGGLVDSLDKKTRDDLNVKIVVQQYGGNAEKAAVVLGANNTGICNNRETCNRITTPILEYISKDFPNQFLDKNGREKQYVTGFGISSYKDAGINSPKDEREKFKEQIVIIKKQLNISFLKHLAQANEINSIITEKRYLENDAVSITNLLQTSKENLNGIQEKAQICFNGPYDECSKLDLNKLPPAIKQDDISSILKRWQKKNLDKISLNPLLYEYFYPQKLSHKFCREKGYVGGVFTGKFDIKYFNAEILCFNKNEAVIKWYNYSETERLFLNEQRRKGDWASFNIIATNKICESQVGGPGFFTGTTNIGNLAEVVCLKNMVRATPPPNPETDFGELIRLRLNRGSMYEQLKSTTWIQGSLAANFYCYNFYGMNFGILDGNEYPPNDVPEMRNHPQLWCRNIVTTFNAGFSDFSDPRNK